MHLRANLVATAYPAPPAEPARKAHVVIPASVESQAIHSWELQARLGCEGQAEKK